ncbi:helix-turn-helix transcriptional regulator [Sinorhizobium meliloti]|uniref:helix-turn-helix transcriptional regulator n=1 Tax=Rhizobium meliloti TaxID=382 RepID=UPI000FE01462|nr:YafY family protein [Sinorhizobium meliloti]MDW9744814.1 HTH domain-containing protein [Sinorhizobium meliloti]MDW9816512.1 HTH domain-containing protein [Sinorhizobium meliloti]MDX0262704.1 HTH domain-containing protein [Sinorhizobium meliloti]MDX0349828.1 HTH domain-containing protein [Sinorhizobium meliloti]RVL57126.1 YafY family transcriptional regulator [Sinorhizobium meliloti]
MSRSERLLDLMQVLRRYRQPVSGRRLAEETGVSLRTLYRDIASLQARGARIEGEPGIGYVLRPGFMLPPMMFSEEEIEALVLGSRWVAKRGDPRLAAAAADALAKIGSVLPADLKEKLEHSTLLVGPRKPGGEMIDLSLLRKSIRSEHKLELRYLDNDGRDSRRTVWPFALGFFEEVRVLAAWCELRQDFRHFRTDRIAEAAMLDDRYPRRRQALLKDWRAVNSIDPAGI